MPDFYTIARLLKEPQDKKIVQLQAVFFVHNDWVPWDTWMNVTVEKAIAIIREQRKIKPFLRWTIRW